MDSVTGKKNLIPRLILFTVLFLSGLSALINQIVWIRKFSLVFGVDIYTMSAVLSAFMGGLAIGSLIFGRLVDKIKNPLYLFLLLELGIGLFALLFPISFNGLIHLYVPVIQKLGLNSNYEQLVKFLFSFLYLLIPTILMGGTLPVIFKFFIKELDQLGWKVSYLYSVNNLGAVIGCFLAGFFIIRIWGVNTALIIGAALNLTNAILVFLVNFRLKSISYQDPPKKKITEEEVRGNILPKPLMTLILWIFAIQGFSTLAFEIIWTRIFVGFSYDKTTYFSSTIILSFIFGLSLGSILIARRVDKRKNLLAILALIEILIGLTSFFLLILFANTALALNLKRTIFDSWMHTMGKEYLIFFLILLVPATLTGMVYPVVSKLYTDNISQVGSKMGMIGFLDTIGSILGSAVAGFMLIPGLGVVKSFIFIVVLNLLLGIILLAFDPSLKGKYKMAFIGLTFLLVLGLYLKSPDKKYFSWWDKNKVEIWSNFIENIPFYDEGPDATVTIREYNNYFAININGHNTAFTTIRDQIANRMLGYIPYMLHQNPKRALVIGFGLGFTVESLIQPEIDTVDVAEICKGVIKSGHTVNTWNNNVIEQPKVYVHLDDGRGFLYKARTDFDIITSNAIHPRLSNNIYTEDFYRLCQSKLRKGGIMCQWATPNWLTQIEYKAQVKAFINVFKYCQLWYLNEYSTILIGSDSPIDIDYHLISERFKSPKVVSDLKNILMTEPYMFTSQYSLEKEALLEYCKDAPSNTDDFPIVEFSKVVNIAPDTGAMDYLSRQPVDFNHIRFDDTTNLAIKTDLLSQMKKYSDYRKYQMRDLIKEVKRQIAAYNSKKTLIFNDRRNY